MGLEPNLRLFLTIGSSCAVRHRPHGKSSAVAIHWEIKDHRFASPFQRYLRYHEEASSSFGLRLADSMLRYAITDRARAAAGVSPQEDALSHQAARLADAGVDYIQLREKDLDPGALASLARRLLAILRATANGPRLLINSRADVAVAVGADGVHLTATPGSLTPADVRRLYAAAGLPEPIISVSCHALCDIRAACDAGATIILFGPVFEKVIWTNEDGFQVEAQVAEGIGLNQLRLACVAASPIPVLALGGITVENAPAALEAGAAGVSAIRMFLI